MKKNSRSAKAAFSLAIVALMITQNPAFAGKVNLNIEPPSAPESLLGATSTPLRWLAFIILAPVTCTGWSALTPFSVTSSGHNHDSNSNVKFREVINNVAADAADYLATDGQRASALLIAATKVVRKEAEKNQNSAVLEMDEASLVEKLYEIAHSL